MEGVTTAITTGMDIVGNVITYVTGHAVLVVLFAMGTFIPAGIKVFKKLKGAVRR